MAEILRLSLVTASISFTVTETKLFKPLRELVDDLPFFGELLSCGYCLGHWVAFGLVAVFRPRLFQSWSPLDYFLTALVVAWLAGFQWVVLCLLTQRASK